MTANTVAQKIPHAEVADFAVRPRLLDLRRAGKVVVNRIVRDPVTGCRAAEYRLVAPGEEAPPVEARLSRQDLLDEIDRLRVDNERLANLATEALVKAEMFAGKLAALKRNSEERQRLSQYY